MFSTKKGDFIAVKAVLAYRLRTWIPACAGMTNERPGHMIDGFSTWRSAKGHLRPHRGVYNLATRIVIPANAGIQSGVFAGGCVLVHPGDGVASLRVNYHREY